MFSKYMARFFKIYGPPGTAFRTRFTTCGADKKASTTTCWRHEGCHDTVSEGCRWRSGRIWPDTTGDTSRSEVGRGVSERPRRRCLKGRRGGRKLIISVSKTGTSGIVGIAPLQSFHSPFKIKITVLQENENNRSSPFEVEHFAFLDQ